jgi:hypothetical protein
MRNMVDPKSCRQDAQGVPLTPDVPKVSREETHVSDPNSDDSAREPALRPMGRCPMHALLEGLDIWHDGEPDF